MQEEKINWAEYVAMAIIDVVKWVIIFPTIFWIITNVLINITPQLCSVYRGYVASTTPSTYDYSTSTSGVL